jgi:Fe-S-cluster containining protein
MDHHFGCTICGDCCKGLRVQLTRREALDWLERGHPVDLLADAAPWFEEPAENDERGRYTRARSFATVSGEVPVRITLRLTSNHTGPCANRLPDMKCAIYETRPLVCRIFPAYIFPFGGFDPANRLCPPEAWAPHNPVLIRDGACVDPATVELIALARATAAEDAAAGPALCADLGIRAAGLANEGYVAHTPEPAALAEALRRSLECPGGGTETGGGDWTVASNRRSTLDALNAAEARFEAMRASLVDGTRQYLGLFADEG